MPSFKHDETCPFPHRCFLEGHCVLGVDSAGSCAWAWVKECAWPGDTQPKPLVDPDLGPDDAPHKAIQDSIKALDADQIVDSGRRVLREAVDNADKRQATHRATKHSPF